MTRDIKPGLAACAPTPDQTGPSLPVLRPGRRGAWTFLITLALLSGMTVACLGAVDGAVAAGRALPVLPAAIAIHFVQIAAAAYGWRVLSDSPPPTILTMLRARWIRESLSALLPVIGIGSGLVVARALARGAGRNLPQALAITTADLTLETLTQAPFLLSGIAIAAVLVPNGLPTGHMAVLAGIVVLAGLGFVLVQRLGGLRLVESLLTRYGFGHAVTGLHDRLMAVHGRRGALLHAAAWHYLAWCLGSLEVWVVLDALGCPVGFGAAYCIESLGMAARSVGFALPAGLAAQEAGLSLIALALGVPLEAAVTLAAFKRVRELLMSLPGLFAWRRLEAQAALVAATHGRGPASADAAET